MLPNAGAKSAVTFADIHPQAKKRNVMRVKVCAHGGSKQASPGFPSEPVRKAWYMLGMAIERGGDSSFHQKRDGLREWWDRPPKN